MALSILLTGATGFLGKCLLRELVSNGHRVSIVIRSTSRLDELGDLRNKVKVYNNDDLEDAFRNENINAVIHTACSYGRGGESYLEIIETNISFGISVAQLSAKYHVNLFLNADTLLDRDISAYSLSKKQFVEWLLFLSKDIKVVNFKIEHMYGPNDGENKFIGWILSQLNKNVDKIDLTSGEQLRDFVYVDDVASAFLTVLDNNKLRSCYNEFDVGSGELNSVRSVVKKIKELYEEVNGNVTTKLNFGVIPYRKGEKMTVDLDIKPLLELGWKPNTSIDNGITSVIKTN